MEHGQAKNFLGCTCLLSMLGKYTTAVHELRKFTDTATVDQIFIEEDRMYFNALQNQNNNGGRNFEFGDFLTTAGRTRNVLGMLLSNSE